MNFYHKEHVDFVHKRWKFFHILKKRFFCPQHWYHATPLLGMNSFFLIFCDIERKEMEKCRCSTAAATYKRRSHTNTHTFRAFLAEKPTQEQRLKAKRGREEIFVRKTFQWRGRKTQ